ncbi:rho guanine nucleotide exchange factor 1-like [Heterodontus francisci]|uniref:rho guanine nucleotide exchange factor 1-like n=1 Tax=Heterodontus francisci TaxID=7792 RepID=UPI00355B34D2
MKPFMRTCEGPLFKVAPPAVQHSLSAGTGNINLDSLDQLSSSSLCDPVPIYFRLIYNPVKCLRTVFKIFLLKYFSNSLLKVTIESASTALSGSAFQIRTTLCVEKNFSSSPCEGIGEGVEKIYEQAHQQELSVQRGRNGTDPSLRGARQTSAVMDLDDSQDVRLPFGKSHGSTNPAMLIIGAEDEEFENDIDPTVDDNCSHFQCIDLLKDRPTYLIIFLHHVILQFDAACVLCYLHGEMFKGANVKDARRMFVDYFHTFLDRGATLRVPVPQEISFELDRCRPDMLCEEGLRNIVKGMQKAMALEVCNQLDDFRNKRMMGMTIGERELLELDSERLIDQAAFEVKEKILAEQLLPKVEEATSNTDDEKSTSVYNAVVTYMKYLGVKTKEPRILEKKRHFLMRRKGPTLKKDSESVRADEKKRKGIGSILDLRRQPRNDPSSSADLRPEGVKASIDRKNSSQISKSQLDATSSRHKSSSAFPEGLEVAGTSGSSHVLPREDSECDAAHPSSSSRPGNENQPFPDSGDVGLRMGSSSEQVSGGEHGQEEGAESERRKLRLVVVMHVSTWLGRHAGRAVVVNRAGDVACKCLV